jgi:hypothetical protein
LGDKRKKEDTHQLNFDMKPAAVNLTIVSELKSELEEIAKLLE